MSENTANTKNKPVPKKQGLSSQFIEKVATEFQTVRAAKRQN